MPAAAPMIIFDDAHGQLGPMTDLRASFEVRTGMFTTAGRLLAHRPRTLAAYWVPEAMRDLLRERADAPVNELPREEIIYCVNGRWAIPDGDLDLAVGELLVEAPSGHVVAALLRHADAEYFLETGQLHERAVVREHEQRLLYRHPWDVIALLPETIPLDINSTRVLEARILTGDVDVVGDHPVSLDKTATIHPHVVFDATLGPIIVHESATIRSGAVICGPCSIGRHATIVDRALIKANTVIGRWCKVGGEVGSTIFQGYANKGHDGHLGDSWVGEWVNVGAGTNNSNLLNTYGEVTMRVESGGSVHRTGLTFLGAIIGDHAKFAIATRIMTGSVIGTGAMIALTAPPPTTVRRFAWHTDRGEKTFRYPRFIDSATAMMARRNVEPTPAYMDALQRLYDRSTAAARAS